ncbi:MAG: hypothetical protein EOP00_34560 [Pedobacter sp.]|nr:MAG: hypothetical protein EOP00_34560 [Pedobacter sp.]
MSIYNLNIAITVNKKDLWFCRICVASIRYYYPEIAIYLIKDELNGKFSTHEIEKYWKVKLINFKQRKFGWSGAKMHFYCDVRFKGQNWLVLDADIVMIGRILDNDYVLNFESDVIVSEEFHTAYESDWFTQTYFDYNKIKAEFPTYTYPGYTFNCGQLFCKGAFLSKEVLGPFFDFEKTPGWKMAHLLPLVDQSVFNLLFPQLSEKNKLKVGRAKYMIWGEDHSVLNEIPLSSITDGKTYPYLIHWAGCIRNPSLKQMNRSDILIFFEKYYYSIVALGTLKQTARTAVSSFWGFLRFIKRTVVDAKIKMR